MLSAISGICCSPNEKRTAEPSVLKALQLVLKTYCEELVLDVVVVLTAEPSAATEVEVAVVD